jgi:hypothetical protein
MVVDGLVRWIHEWTLPICPSTTLPVLRIVLFSSKLLKAKLQLERARIHEPVIQAPETGPAGKNLIAA